MDRRTFLNAAGATSVAAATGGILSTRAFAQTKPETAKLAMGFGLDPVFAPHMVAVAKGWFRDAGFTDVSTKTFSGGAVAGEALVANEIQLWTPGNLPPISMAHNAVPIVVLGTNAIAWAVDKLVARKDANIRTPEDLWIKIGLLQGPTASADSITWPGTTASTRSACRWSTCRRPSSWSRSTPATSRRCCAGSRGDSMR
ncbi:MAG: ABC transporter substrate-binding protein [Betaproteobacteria bacterium]|nr:ABC transporter substrate-binding protein [Betaproteobacteria bacterium]